VQRLKDRVAVVTGASRNLGRGIALALGEEGATVYVTGRSVRGEQTKDFPGANVEDTAEQITASGGIGIPVRCDHSVDKEVKALFDRVEQEQGHLDILVNNAWGGYDTITDWESWEAPFWEQPLSRWDVMCRVGLRSHMTSSYFAVPLMLSARRRRRLIVNTTVAMEEAGYPANLFYWLTKVAINRMTYKMAEELREHGVVVVAVAPGWLRTESVLQMYKTDDQSAHEIPELQGSESTQYAGRAVVALATDSKVMEKTGRVLRTRKLGPEYGFTDVDGRQPALDDHT
jgi:NAD(P)-dependent dehydrogenase (short-subunit alcohol dehydrogenase family)